MNICESVQTDDVDPSTVYYFYENLSAEVKLEVLSKLFSMYMVSDMYVSVPSDFLSYTSKAMMNLKSSRHTNVLYNLAKGIGSLRVDGTTFEISDWWVLIEYIANFYVCNDVNQVLGYNLCSYIDVHRKKAAYYNMQ